MVILTTFEARVEEGISGTPRCIISRGRRCVSSLLVPTSQSITKPTPKATRGSPKSPSLLHLGMLHLPHLPSWMCDMCQNRKPRAEIKRVGKNTCFYQKQGYAPFFFCQIPTLLLPLTIIASEQ